ncbi:histidine kinase [Aureimonas altamirensis]|uniref:histidine kinase n=1 Tax=Aureimonas altamirensis TaxID=370622 RepID=UPI002036E933|nr:histidine kinase [Aureimonas altamirensis]MCM2504618.1 histidine kinase [Aureimonas altamirensis]
MTVREGRGLSLSLALSGSHAAGRRLPQLRSRIMLGVVGLSAALWLLLAFGMVVNARLATRAEVSASFAIAERFAEARIASIGPDGTLEAYRRLVDELGEMRHVSAALSHPLAGPAEDAAADDDDDGEEAPRWFAALIEIEPIDSLFNLTLDDGSTATLMLSANDADEIAEVWQDFSFILPVTILYGAILSLLSMLLVSLVFARLRRIEDALDRLREGALDTRLDRADFAEFDRVTGGFNDLASHLSEEKRLNRNLARRLLDAHEAERRALANDLHDELGPHLFSLRAAVAMLKRKAARAEDGGGLEEPLHMLEDEVATLQSATRRLLAGLRPMAVGGVPLRDTVEGAVDSFRRSSPDTHFACRTETADATFGEVVDLTVYRFVQESVLNALKHGKAGRVEVAIALRPGDASCDAVLEATVANDGTMPVASNREGYGLIGIAERVEALGGFATAPAVSGGQTICRIAIPVRAAGDGAARGARP